MKYGVSYELNLISYDQNIIDNYIKMENSPVGDAPETLVEQIIGWVDEHIINPIINAAITIGGFIYHGLVVIGNFIKQAIDVVKEFLMELWDTSVENVKRAVEVVKEVVDAAINWVAKEMRRVMSKWAGVIEKAVEGYEWELSLYFEGKKDVESLSLIWDALKFSYIVIGAELGLGVLAIVLTGGVSSVSSLFGKVLGSSLGEIFLEYASKAKGLIGFAIGALMREIVEWVVEQDTHLDEEGKQAVKTIMDMMVAGIGIISTRMIGDSDLMGLAYGYVIFVSLKLVDILISSLSSALNLSDYEEMWSKSILSGILLSVLAVIAVESVVKMTVSDVVAGMFGFIDELILGYLFVSSLFAFSESVRGIVDMVLQNVRG